MAANGGNKILCSKDFKKLRIAQTNSEFVKVKSLDFHYNGTFLAYNTNESLKILELTDERVIERFVDCKKSGIGMIKFWNDEILASCNKNYLRLLDFTERQYIRYFPGHAKEIVSIDVTIELAASGSKDQTMRIWDIKTSESINTMKFLSTPFVTFYPSLIPDKTKQTLAVAHNSKTIEVYETRNTSSCTKKFEFEKIDGVEWTSLKYSPDGKKFIVTTDSSLIKIIDAETGQEIMDIKDYTNIAQDHIGACFSPDSSFVVGGSFEGIVHVWSLETNFRECNLKSKYEGSCQQIAANPKFMNLATVSHNEGPGSSVHLWIEKESED